MIPEGTNVDLFKKLYPTNADRIIKKLEAIPEYVRPVVTLSDKQDKFITRYFVRQINDASLITEVDKKQYSEFKTNSRFVTVMLRWKIVGKLETVTHSNNISVYGVNDLNKIALANADLTFGGLRNYITNYSEFWLGES
jgi:hypothetical protein